MQADATDPSVHRFPAAIQALRHGGAARDVYLVANAPENPIEAHVGRIGTDDVVIQFNTCACHDALQPVLDRSILLMHLGTVIMAPVDLHRPEIHARIHGMLDTGVPGIVMYPGRLVQGDDIKFDAMERFELFDYDALMAPLLRNEARYVPSIGFSTVIMLWAVNLLRIADGNAPHRIILTGFSGVYSNSASFQHDFAGEQALYPRIPSLFQLQPDSAVTAFAAPEADRLSFQFRNTLPDQLDLANVDRSELLVLMARWAFHVGDTELALRLLRFAEVSQTRAPSNRSRMLLGLKLTQPPEGDTDPADLFRQGTSPEELKVIRDLALPPVFSDSRPRHSRDFGVRASYSPRKREGRRALVINETCQIPANRQHLGCAIVCSEIEARLNQRGVEVAGWVNFAGGMNDVLAMDPGLDFDLVVINGEGTLHHNSTRGFEILSVGKYLADAGKSVSLINASWQQNGPWQYDLCAGYDLLACRDTRSADELSRGGREVLVVPDLSWGHSLASVDGVPGVDIAVQDCVVLQTSACLSALARELDQPLHVMSRFNQELQAAIMNDAPVARYPRVLDELLLQAAGGWITGRYHGAILALRSRRPTVCLESNTDKIRNLAGEVGLEGLVLGADVLKAPVEQALDACRASLGAFGAPAMQKVEAFEREAETRIGVMFDRICA